MRICVRFCGFELFLAILSPFVDLRRFGHFVSFCSFGDFDFFGRFVSFCPFELF